MKKRRCLLTGASGHLGAFLCLEARRRELDLTAWTGRTACSFAGFELHPVELTNPAAVESAFAAARPDVVLHAAALSAIADCHREPTLARRLNTEVAHQLALLAHQRGARFLQVSTDLVFDGQKGGYREEDPPRPLSIYAQTKRAAEEAVLAVPGTLVARVAWLAGPKLLGSPRFFDELVRKLKAGQPVSLFVDEFRTPLGLPSAAAALWDLACGGETGLLHLGGPERLSRFEMGVQLARHLGSPVDLIQPARQAEVAAPEPRPADVSLDSSRWRSLYPQSPWPTFGQTLRQLDRHLASSPPEAGGLPANHHPPES